MYIQTPKAHSSSHPETRRFFKSPKRKRRFPPPNSYSQFFPSHFQVPIFTLQKVSGREKRIKQFTQRKQRKDLFWKQEIHPPQCLTASFAPVKSCNRFNILKAESLNSYLKKWGFLLHNITKRLALLTFFWSSWNKQCQDWSDLKLNNSNKKIEVFFFNASVSFR